MHYLKVLQPDYDQLEKLVITTNEIDDAIYI